MDCYKRAADQRKSKFKRVNKSNVTGQKPGSKAFTGCHQCGSKRHLKSDCPSDKGGDKKTQKYEKKSKNSDKKSPYSNKRRRMSINSFVKDSDNSDSDDS